LQQQIEWKNSFTTTKWVDEWVVATHGSYSRGSQKLYTDTDTEKFVKRLPVFWCPTSTQYVFYLEIWRSPLISNSISGLQHISRHFGG
jgi:hypothetical protein